MPNLYNNKFFTYLKQREEIGIKKEMNKQGVSINDQEKFKIGFFNPAFSLTTSTIGLIKDIKDLSDDLSGATDAQQTNTFDTFFDTHVGEYHGLNLWMPLLTVRHRWFVWRRV